MAEISRAFSRSLRPGSIAAGGTGESISGALGFSRSLRPGSIAAPGTRRTTSGHSRFPGLSGRAPLRPDSHGHDAHPHGVFPVSQAGLHCGVSGGRVVCVEPVRFSRSLRPGSIAACRTPGDGAPHLARFPGLSGRAPLRRSVRPARFLGADLFSRSLRPGSIAASPTCTATVTGGGFPGLSGRAPLRRNVVRRSNVLFLGFPGLSGRAPLRRRGRAWPPRRARGVFPVSQAGLHCGMFFCGGIPAGQGRFSRSLRPGSIAASQRHAPPALRRTGFPGLSGRAPLRPRATDTCRGDRWPVFPVSQAGLHCG